MIDLKFKIPSELKGLDLHIIMLEDGEIINAPTPTIDTECELKLHLDELKFDQKYLLVVENKLKQIVNAEMWAGANGEDHLCAKIELTDEVNHLLVAEITYKNSLNNQADKNGVPVLKYIHEEFTKSIDSTKTTTFNIA